jgi:malonyl-CoA O-methyltransferase
MEKERDVAEAYDAWAPVYDSDANATRDLDAAVVRGLGLDATGDVLELGCGTGKNTEWLAARARSVLALDFSPGMLERARARVATDRVRFARHDIREPLPVADAAFDLVLGNLVLEHVERLEPVFAEAARGLRPGGILLFCELHPFRQLEGSHARFVKPETGEVVRVTAFPHDVSDYLGAGIAANLRLVGAHDWRDTKDLATVPRLFSTLWKR